jgi:hypothetical protein
MHQILDCRDHWLSALATGQSLPSLVQSSFEACRESVVQLGSQLVSLGYPVKTFIFPAPADLSERIARIEDYTGKRIPVIIREFWQIVGGISVVDLKEYKHVAFWDDLGITGAHQFCDGVHVDVIDDDWLTYTAEDFDNYAENDDERTFLFSLAPDGYHKDDISGGPPYAFGHGSDWAPTFENFRWAGYRRPESAVPDPSDFLSYLRTAILECGGFPGLLGHPNFESIRPTLARDLRPF